eukprot:1160442-Pelagomonas_calceolata.AAC.8
MFMREGASQQHSHASATHKAMSDTFSSLTSRYSIRPCRRKSLKPHLPAHAIKGGLLVNGKGMLADQASYPSVIHLKELPPLEADCHEWD